ncbi:MAG: type IV secretory system conjugative DNA transfer family protein [Candidatus Dormibacteria bacterium]
MRNSPPFGDLPLGRQERLNHPDTTTNLALGATAAAVVLAAVVWAAGQVGARVVHGAWPSAPLSDAPGIVFRLAQNAGTPAAAWPSVDRHLIPGAPAFYVTLLVLMVVVFGAVAFAVMTWAGRRGRGRGRHTNPDHRGYGRVRDIAPPRHLSEELARGFEPGPNPFLGVEETAIGLRAIRMQSVEEHSGITGPPRMLKTVGHMAIALGTHDGPAVTTSPKPDILDLTYGIRAELARKHGGRIYIVDLSGRVAQRYGFEPTRIDPLVGCRDTTVATQRVETWLATISPSAQEIGNAGFFNAHAATLLRPLVHAAALEGLGIRQVIRWLNAREIVEAGLIIQRHNSPAQEWVEAMRSLVNSPAQVTVDNFFQTASSALKALQDPAVLSMCEGSTFDAEEFIATHSTMYLLDPRADGGLSPYAPINSGQIEWIVETAFNRGLRSPNRRCNPSLMLNLDELPNIAPLPTLPNILSVGGSQGVLVNWACQSYSQLRERYGREKAQTILTSTTYQIVLGGLRDRQDLEDISALAGEYEEWEESRNRAQLHGDSVSQHLVRRRVLPVEVLASLPQGEAVLLHRGQVMRLKLRAMQEIPALAKLIRPPGSSLERTA